MKLHDDDAPLTLTASQWYTDELELHGTSINRGPIILSLTEERRLSKLLRDRAGIRKEMARRG